MPKEENRRRDPKDVVLEAELLASSPERVRNWLEENAKEKAATLLGREGEIEQALLKRGDPLITLSLAQYASSSDVVRAILSGPARANKAVRLAVLMNETVGKVSLSFPSVLMENRQIGQFLAELNEEEILALFGNRELDDEFLTNFFEQKSPWQALDEERRFVAIAALYRNPRLRSAHKGPYDGWAEHTHNGVYRAAWKLASEVPVTHKWAVHLGSLYGEMSLGGYSIDKPLELTVRWVPDAADTERIEAEKKDLERGRLGAFAAVRKGIARHAVRSGHNSKEERRALANHDDPAVRAAFYGGATLTLDEMKSADERDPFLSFEEMMWNPAAWRTKAHRKLLHDMAWDSKRDPKSYMDPQNMFEARLEYYRGKYPEWFKDEDEAAEASDSEAQAGAGDVVGRAMDGIHGELFAGNDLARATHMVVVKLLKRSAWLGWGIAAVLALLLYKTH